MLTSPNRDRDRNVPNLTDRVLLQLKGNVSAKLPFVVLTGCIAIMVYYTFDLFIYEYSSNVVERDFYSNESHWNPDN